MRSPRFVRLTLRTTDGDAARAFYASVLGIDLVDSNLVIGDAFERHALYVEPLPEASRAKGARSHWLGEIGTSDVQRSVDAMLAHGAVRLGPPPAQAVDERVILRDPGGAVVAITRASATPAPLPIVWYQHQTADLSRSRAAYHDIFGWDFRASVDRGSFGIHHPFAWSTNEPIAGAMFDITGRPELHPHWLFHFHTPSFEASLEAVVRGGGLVLGPWELEDGQRVAVCDDPQGAAFALRSPPRALDAAPGKSS